MNGTFLDWEWTWTAHNVTRPSRLESKLGMISQWFFTTDSEALCDDITTCRYHHKHLPRTHMPPILSHYLYFMFHASWSLVPSALKANLDSQLKKTIRVLTILSCNPSFGKLGLPSRCAFSPRIILRHGVRRTNTMRFR